MTLEDRFDVRLDVDAEKEYGRLDGSVLAIVNAAIDELVYRADEVGKVLSNSIHTKLAGCREIKLRDAGIRIIYRVTDEIVHVLRIVYILTIERRTRDMAFKIAHSRYKQYRKISKKDLIRFHEEQHTWPLRASTRRGKKGGAT
ncbi:hypothetical protein NYE40_01900 [Paenibacillus sp. FSL W8-1187]|nr:MULTISPECIES: hypothetical protein [Paenibacillus]